MEKKYKFWVKSSLISFAAAAAIGALVYFLCRFLMRNIHVDFMLRQQTTALQLTLSSMIAVTALFIIMTMQIGHRENTEYRNSIKENKERAKRLSSNVSVMNFFSMIDDSEEKEYYTLYGERIKAGEDHGAMYMLMKLVAMIFGFMTASAGLIIICMLLSLGR